MIRFFKRLWCKYLHHGDYPSLLWNGSQNRWMIWCGQCGNWRPAPRYRLEKKLTAMTELVKDSNYKAWINRGGR